jgi:lipoprotein-anchoring transpeptidase ErfK/SrfK
MVNVARRRLELLDGDRTLIDATVGVGGPDSPTPRGRFAVTDKLSGPEFNAAYGCCIIALSATQDHPPPGWAGGDRIAIHGTDSPQTIGAAASTGCVHGTTELMETLMRLVPLGTPVRIE